MSNYSELQQRPGESYFEWKRRLIVGRIEKEFGDDIDWSVICSVLGEDCSPDHFRKVARGIYEYYLYEKERGKKVSVQETDKPSFQQDSSLDELTIKTYQLMKERKKLQAEKNEIHRWLRESARDEIFLEKYLNALKDRKLSVKVPNYRIERKIGDIDTNLGIADSHYGREVVVYGLENEIINEYNIKIFEKRMWDLLNQTITKIEKENLTHLNVFNLSDSIDGILRMTQLQAIQLGIVDSCIGYTDFMTTWLNELSKYVYVDYYSCQGNHTEIRPLGSKRGEFAHENVEKWITWHLQRVLEDNPNITIHDNKPLVYVDVVGTKILATHGQDEKNLEQSIKEYKLAYEKPIHTLYVGHLHSSHEKVIGQSGLQDIEFVQFPSICGIDEYSIKYKKTANAGAKMLIYERGLGKTATFNFKLA